MDSINALRILNEFVTGSLVLPTTPLEKCQITALVNEALKHLSTDDADVKSLIDRVQIKKEELLNPEQILDEVKTLPDIDSLDHSIHKVIFDHILSEKASLNQTHLKLLSILLESPLYSDPTFPHALFLEKVFSSLGLPYEGIDIEKLKSFIHTVLSSEDLFLFIKSQIPEHQYRFIDSEKYTQKQFLFFPSHIYPKMLEYFLSLDRLDPDSKDMAWGAFCDTLIKIPLDHQISFTNSLLLKPIDDLEEFFYTISTLSEAYKDPTIPISHAEFLSTLFFQNLNEGRDRATIESLMLLGIKRPDFINRALFERLAILNKDTLNCVITYLPIFLKIESPESALAAIVSVSPPNHEEQIYQIFLHELRKNESLSAICDALEIKFSRTSFSDDTKLQFLIICIQINSSQKSVLLELSKYRFFQTISLDELNLALSKFIPEMTPEMLDSIFKIGMCIANSLADFLEITTTLCLSPPILNEALQKRLFDFMLTPHPEIQFPPSTFPLFFHVMENLASTKDLSVIESFLKNTFTSLGLQSSTAELENLYFLWYYCYSCPELFIFIKEKEPLEQQRILQLPPSIWKDLIKCSSSLWKDMINCYEILKANTFPEELNLEWESFFADITSLPPDKQPLLSYFLIYFFNKFQTYEYNGIYLLLKFKKTSFELFQQIVSQYARLHEAGIPPIALSQFLIAISENLTLINPDLITALLSLDLPMQLGFLNHLNFISFFPNIFEFLSILQTETASDPNEKLFAASFKILQSIPYFAPVCEAFLRRTESQTDDPISKTRILKELVRIHQSDDKTIEILMKFPLFSITSIGILKLLKISIESVPQRKRDAFFSQAFKLTNSYSIISMLTRVYPFVELTDEMILKLQPLSGADLIKAINFLSFIPKSLQLERCNPPFNLKALKDLPIETLESTYFPHFKIMLESTNSIFVQGVTEFLYTNFIHIFPPKINADSPLGRLIITMHILSHDNPANIKNPFNLFSRVTQSRRVTFSASLPYQTLDGEPVALNLDQITKTADKALMQWTYADLETALGRKAISTDDIRALFQALRARNGERINQFLRDSGLRSLEALETSICEDDESSKWHRTGSPDDSVSDTTRMFNACLNFYLSNLAPPTSDAPLSDSEIALFGFINVFIYCPTGRVEQLRTMYTNLKSVLPPAFQESREKVDYLKDYLNQIYRGELTNFLRENPDLFAKLHAGASNVHESEYIINLLGRRLGLLNGEVIFDPNTGVIHSEILDKTAEELFQFIIDQFTPEVLISKIQARITQDLGEDSSIKDALGSSFERFLTGPEMGWYYNRVAEFADPDPSKELVSKLFCRNLLLHAGILEARAPDIDTPSKPHLSLGVNDTGHIRVTV